uniref:Ribonuclease H-like domain-containing protein n=1 Tax=Tanacetum cinerariifolium TaxID=118510 RepID=A0A6L2MFU1_TANCI|nr:ribonuclease H-like domain-containing protein [Tanacetum cinerariifolium]
MIAYLTKSNASEEFNQIIDFLNGSSIKYALTVKPNIYVSCIKQFWNSVTVKKVNDVMRLQALVNKKKLIITEALIRDALRLDYAEGVKCLPNEEIFVELARMGYEKPSTKLTFYKTFFSSQWKFLIHTILVGKGFFGVETLLFEGMIVEQQVDEGDDEVHDEGVPADSVVVKGVVSTADEVPTAVKEPSFPSPTPPTQPPQPLQDQPSTSQVYLTPPQSPQAQPQSPQHQPQPSQDARLPIDLLQNLMDTCKTLTRRVKHLELDKIAQALEITKLKQKVKKLERRNKLKVLKLRRLKRVGSAQRIGTSDDTAIDDDVAVKKSANVEDNVDIQGRKEESQAGIYKIDLEHAKKVLSMHEEESDPTELQEVVDVVTTAKIITEVVTAASDTITAASTTITAADVLIHAAIIVVAPILTAAPNRRRKGVVIRDPEETATPSIIIHSEAKSKDKGKGILVEEPKPLKKQAQIKQDEAYARELEAEMNKNIDWDDVIDHVQRKQKEDNAVKRYQALKRKPQTEAQARKNMMIYLKNVAGFKIDYFKGMTYDDIRKAAKRQKLDEEIKELRKHLMIVPNEDDDVYTEATHLARKVPVVDYEIYTEAMFEKPDIQAQIWKNQSSVYGLAKVKSWKLLESCGVQIITFTTTQLILLVEMRYPLTRFTLDQMLNNVRLEVEEESEVFLELLRSQFFLATKDETSRILKSFINEIENLADKKVKIIRCDNGTEFKNKVTNEFYKEKDHLGNFDGKSNEGFFVGYSTNCKDFRVYNTRTRKVEENMHIKFLENKPLIICDGPKWLFDINTLTELLNYVLVIAGFEDPNYPDKVYKVEKALYGLHQALRAWYGILAKYFLNNEIQRGLQVKQKSDGIFISQDKYVDEILRKFKYKDVKTASTPMDKKRLCSKIQIMMMLMFISIEFCDKYNMVDFLKKHQGSEDFHQIVDFLNASDIRTLDNREIELNATIDGQVKTITEAFVWRHLKLADADGINTLPTTKIFEHLALMEKIRTKIRRMGIRIPQSNVPTSIADEAITKEMHDGLRRATTTTSSLEAEQGSGNISKTQTKATPSRPSSLRTSSEDKVTTLKNEFTSTKAVYNMTLITLTKRVKKLKKKLKHKRRRAVIDSSEDEEAIQSSKQGEAHETGEHIMDLSTASQIDDDETLAETLLNIKRSAAKDKGKAIMQESERPKKIKKKEMIDEARLDQENLAQAEQCDDVQAQIQADEDLSQRMLEEEKESLFIKERSKLLTEFIDKRKKMLAAKRAAEKRNKPPTQAQQRTYMSNYIKNMGGYTLKKLKQYSFEEIKMLFDNTMKSESLKIPDEEELGQEQEDEEEIVQQEDVVAKQV